ncbi:hypothetical protein B0H13DRAFT_1883133 [Mycena leptocephala]|nr:hypothetical protein B0H13DRAFT_1883133 [Mycena leptocephala]
MFKLFSLPTLLLASLAIGVVVSESTLGEDGCRVCTQEIPQCNCSVYETCIIIPHGALGCRPISLDAILTVLDVEQVERTEDTCGLALCQNGGMRRVDDHRQNQMWGGEWLEAPITDPEAR